MEHIVKILLTGDTNTGKTTLARAIIEQVAGCNNFDFVAIDSFRKPTSTMEEEYSAKLSFAQHATKPVNSIIECSGIGLTANILLASLRDLIEEMPTIVVAFHMQPADHSNTPNRVDPMHAVFNFREFNPVVITHSHIDKRLRVVRRILKQKTEPIT